MKFVKDQSISQGANEDRFTFLMANVKIKKGDYILAANEEDIFNWDDLKLFYNNSVIDYRRYRDGLKVFGYGDQSTWDALSQVKKQIIAGNRACSDARIDEAFTENSVLDTQTRDEMLSEFDILSQLCRKDRFTQVKTRFRQVIFVQHLMQIIDELERQTNLLSNFINHGLQGTIKFEGVAEDQIEAILNYVDATKLAYYDQPNVLIHGLYGDNPLYFIIQGIRDKPLLALDGATPLTQAQKDDICDYALEYLRYGPNHTEN